jgi:RNA polymerase sigma factor (sigma-70 family)
VAARAPQLAPGVCDVTAREQLLQELRPASFAIAYRMLGSVYEAEDVVQEALLRLHQTIENGERIASPRAFVATVTTRLAIDELRSARARRERYVGEWLPEPILTDEHEDPARQAEMADSLSVAMLVLLESLSPEQRVDRQPRQARAPRPHRRLQLSAALTTTTTPNPEDPRNVSQEKKTYRRSRTQRSGTGSSTTHRRRTSQAKISVRRKPASTTYLRWEAERSSRMEERATCPRYKFRRRLLNEPTPAGSPPECSYRPEE